MKVHRITAYGPRRRIIQIEAQNEQETEVVDGLFETLHDADDCVLIADRKGEIVIYGGSFSWGRPDTLRDFIGKLFGVPDDVEPARKI